MGEGRSGFMGASAPRLNPLRAILQCSAGKDGGILVHVDYCGERLQLAPEQIMAMVLVDLKRYAEKETGTPVTDCVIGVPTYYTEEERQSMIDAAKLANINLLRLMNENTATALSYGIYKTDLPENDPVHVAFVDMGHSSLQVSVVAFKKGQLKVLSHAWDRDLGGRDFDMVLFDHFCAEFKDKYKIDVKSNKKASFRLMLAIDKLKKVLSANPEAPISVECLMDDKDVKSTMTRDKLEELAAPVLERMRVPIAQALQESGLTPDQVAVVEVVGGASRMPAFVRAVREIFGKEPSRTMNAKECVSRGCALQCAMISPLFRVRDFEVIDALPYGVALQWESKDKGTVTNNLFPRNSEHVPTKSKIVTFIRAEPFQIRALYADDSPLLPGSSRDLRAVSVGPFSVPAGQENVTLKVQAKVDINGMVRVEAVHAEEKIEEVVDLSAEEAAAAAAPNGEEAAGAEAPKTTTRTRVNKVVVPFSMSLVGLPQATMTAYGEQEAAMDLTERIAEETADRKNALEAYVYDMRNKVGGGNLADFAPEGAKAEFLRLLDETENWLYEDGEDVEKKVYVERLESLKKHGDPIVRRSQEAEARGPAAQRLLAVCESYLAQAKSDASQYAHIEQDERAKVMGECQAALNWLNEKLQLQDKASKQEDPVVLSTDIDRKAESIDRFCKPIMTKPAPAPKKPAPAANGGDATAMDTDGPEEGPQPPAEGEMEVEVEEANGDTDMD